MLKLRNATTLCVTKKVTPLVMQNNSDSEIGNISSHRGNNAQPERRSTVESRGTNIIP